MSISTSKKSKKSLRPAEKIRIDTLQDLNKLTFTQIKSLQIWNLEGKLFQQAFQDALHVKKNDKLIKHAINSIELQLNYKTDFGNTVCILGSCEVFGNWSPTAAYDYDELRTNRCKMHWSEGHIWKAWIQFDQLANEFHYKYAVQDSSTSIVKRWESGGNRSFDVISVEEYLSSPQNAYSVHTSASYKFEVGVLQLVYLREKEHLIIIDTWQN